MRSIFRVINAICSAASCFGYRGGRLFPTIRYDTFVKSEKKVLYNDVRVSASLFLAPLKEICDRNVRRAVGGLARECL